MLRTNGGGRPVSILMYSHDSIGLGHMRRNTSIAAHLVGELPNANVLMVVGCPTGVFFDLPPRVDFVKLPSVLKTATNQWESRKLAIGTDTTKLLRAKLIEQVVDVFQPDIFFVDHVPTGVWGELLPTFEMLREKRAATKLVLGLRDILDSAAVIRDQWRKQDIPRVIEEHYDSILVYGARNIFDTAAAYGLHEVTDKVRHCGYLCRPLAGNASGAVVKRAWPNRRHFVVVTAGGGHDAQPMMRASLDAVRLIDPDKRPEVLLITGPLMAIEQRAELRRQAAGLPVTVEDRVPDAAVPMAAADLVVTMGGYNTVMEALRFGRQTIVVPRNGPSVEQKIRASLLDQMGLVRAVMLDEATAPRLAQQITAALEAPMEPKVQFKFDGLSNVLAGVKALLGTDALEPMAASDPALPALEAMQ